MIVLNLTLDQTQALLGLIDNGVKRTGLKGAVPAATLAVIIEAAVKLYHDQQKLVEDAKNDKRSVSNERSEVDGTVISS